MNQEESQQSVRPRGAADGKFTWKPMGAGDGMPDMRKMMVQAHAGAGSPHSKRPVARAQSPAQSRFLRRKTTSEQARFFDSGLHAAKRCAE